VIGITLQIDVVSDTQIGGGCDVLITSVLHILDRVGLEKVSATTSVEEFQTWIEHHSEEEPAPEKPKERQNEVIMVRPLLPADVLPPTLAGQRGMEVFMRALEEVEREGRPPIVDVFE
jgi:hypothetical protein